MRKLVLVFVSAAFIVSAQTAGNPISAAIKAQYTNVKNNVIRSAEKMPEENYSFKPIETVRSFGQLIGHVADANFGYCGRVLGEKPPMTGVEKSKTSKADLVQALKESFAFCDKAYDGATDAKIGTGERPEVRTLIGNMMHDMEHYGNLVTYLRMKGLVPPSSERNR